MSNILDNISDDEISSLNIPTGRPLVYEFDEKMNVKDSYYLGDQAEIEAEMEKVKDQAKIDFNLSLISF